MIPLVRCADDLISGFIVGIDNTIRTDSMEAVLDFIYSGGSAVIADQPWIRIGDYTTDELPYQPFLKECGLALILNTFRKIYGKLLSNFY